MPTANVSLSRQQVDFIRQRIDQGQFQNVSEAVRAGLHLLEQQTQQDRLKLEILKKAAKKGFDDISDGNFELLSPDTISGFIDSVRAVKPKRHRK